uniref:Superoxide dismutase [Cu-Zn] n=1 Tax=Anguilla anguilla TaxID=7936 RepID=A0A0E9XTS9_ANGAN
MEIVYVQSINKMTKMARNTPSFNCLLLVVFLGFQTFCCEEIPLKEDHTAAPSVPDFNGTQYAVCEMRPSSLLPEGQLQIYGQVLFRQVHPKDALQVMINLQGFPSKDDQSRAIHIHEFGDLSSGCDSTGGHYNPLKVNHPNHPGDLGNFSGHNRSIRQVLIAPATLFGELSVLGRAVVIHAKEDDMGLGSNEGSLLHGNAGQRLACCIIGVSTSRHWNKTVEPTVEE